MYELREIPGVHEVRDAYTAGGLIARRQAQLARGHRARPEARRRRGARRRRPGGREAAHDRRAGGARRRQAAGRAHVRRAGHAGRGARRGDRVRRPRRRAGALRRRAASPARCRCSPRWRRSRARCSRSTRWRASWRQRVRGQRRHAARARARRRLQPAGHRALPRGARRDPAGADRDVLARTIAGAGRAVLVSGLAVAIALAGLYVFADPLLSAMALGGVLAVGTATLAGLTLVPALIAVAHHRIPAPGTRTWVWRRERRSRARTPRAARRVRAAPSSGGGAHRHRPRCSRSSIPALGLEVADADARSLPADAQERRVLEAVERDFTAGPVDPIQVLIAAAPSDPAVTALHRADATAARREGRDDPGRPAAVGHRDRGRRRGAATPASARSSWSATIRGLDAPVRVLVGGAAAELVDAKDSTAPAAAAGAGGRRPADGAAAVRPHALRARRR